jgi:N-acetylglutamate synthase-like GNAT family acetyltransferase
MLEPRTMPQGPVTIRRGKRTDFPLLLQLLAPTALQERDKAQVRHWRRVASSLLHDFYVAEQEGTVCGMVLVSYIRSLTSQGWRAILDFVAPVSALDNVGLLLLTFAKTRAQQRGCQQIMVWTTTQDQSEELSTLFCQAGFLRSGEVLSCALQ